MTRPDWRATSRLQFHAGFTFDDAVAILPYLQRLGISHLYASPVFAARPGSTHGYDVTDPTRINPELGGEERFRRRPPLARRPQRGSRGSARGAARAPGPWIDVLEARIFDPADLSARRPFLVLARAKPR